jgi:uncharacterized protein (TIGR04255 family)
MTHLMELAATKPDTLPSYKLPPVTEVVCGIQFAELAALSAPHLGLWWQTLQPDFPLYRENPPLGPVIEKFPAGTHLQQSRQVHVTNVPELPRMWFMNPDQSRVIQVQRDRFLTNWKKVAEDQHYPRYHEVMGFFLDQFDKFRQIVRDSELGEISPRQYEMTYVNHIPYIGWDGTQDFGKVMPDFSWRKIDRFLPAPEGNNWTTTFLLPNQDGRLYIEAATAVHTQTKESSLQLTLTVRGIDESGKLELMSEWFDTAREWIVRAFTDITSEHMQQNVWRRER